MIVPRVEAEPGYIFPEKLGGIDMGYTSLYTLFEGNLGTHFSYSVSNHWFAFTRSFDDTKDLYRNTWRADSNNWVDWANVTVHFGNFSITAGKDYIHMGTFENDAYDFDAHWQLNSALWNNYQVYQWGGSLNWTSSDEATLLMLQVTSDQTMERPFGSRSIGDYAFNLFGSHETDELKVMGSVLRCSIGWLGSFGVEAYVSDAITVGGDGYVGNNYSGASLRINGQLGDHFELFAKGGFDVGQDEDFYIGNRIYGGLGGNWYPLRNRDLRVHALCAAGTNPGNLQFSVGVTYALNLKLF